MKENFIETILPNDISPVNDGDYEKDVSLVDYKKVVGII